MQWIVGGMERRGDGEKKRRGEILYRQMCGGLQAPAGDRA